MPPPIIPPQQTPGNNSPLATLDLSRVVDAIQQSTRALNGIITALGSFFLGTANTWTAVQTFQEPIVLSTFVVASLPAGVKGMRAQASDSTQTLAAGIGTAVVGGSTHFVPVYFDGTSWLIG